MISELQSRILQQLAPFPAIGPAAANYMPMGDLVAAVFGAPNRKTERQHYQAAWASVSRAVTRLQRAGFVYRWLPQFGNRVRVGLTDEGRRLNESLQTTHLTDALQQSATTSVKRNPTPTELAAKLVHVSAKYVYYIRRIEREAPDLYAKMETGELKVLSAMQILRNRAICH